MNSWVNLEDAYMLCNYKGVDNWKAPLWTCLNN